MKALPTLRGMTVNAFAQTEVQDGKPCGIIFVERPQTNDPYVTAWYRLGDSEWCHGHYFTDYAEAFADFIQRATDHGPRVKPKIPQPANGKWTMADIKAANEAAGNTFFGRAEMRASGDTMKSFKVRQVVGRVFIERTRAALGYNGLPDPRTVGDVREFYPETGRIGSIQNASTLAGIINA